MRAFDTTWDLQLQADLYDRRDDEADPYDGLWERADLAYETNRDEMEYEL